MRTPALTLCLAFVAVDGLVACSDGGGDAPPIFPGSGGVAVPSPGRPPIPTEGNPSIVVPRTLDFGSVQTGRRVVRDLVIRNTSDRTMAARVERGVRVQRCDEMPMAEPFCYRFADDVLTLGDRFDVPAGGNSVIHIEVDVRETNSLVQSQLQVYGCENCEPSRTSLLVRAVEGGMRCRSFDFGTLTSSTSCPSGNLTCVNETAHSLDAVAVDLTFLEGGGFSVNDSMLPVTVASSESVIVPVTYCPTGASTDRATATLEVDTWTVGTPFPEADLSGRLK